ncbi:MAG: ribonuclease H-like YkuK family protein [Candidatus Bipolaricaulota bacterium]
MSQYYNPTEGRLSFSEVIDEIVEMMQSDQRSEYEIVVGTDSHAPSGNHEIDFVSAIVIHRVGKGGRYFWKRVTEDGIYTLRDKIYKEAFLSFELAKEFMKKLEEETLLDYNLEIHVDVGQHGKTKEIIDEVVGMIIGSGFEVRTKPHSYGASTVADKHT